MPKLLFFDVDGTLVNRKREVLLSTKRALQMAKERGHEIYICSGRSRAGLGEEIISLNFDGYICGQGAYVECGGELISHKVIAVDNLKQLIEKVHSVGGILSLQSANRLHVTAEDKKRLRRIFLDTLVKEGVINEWQVDHFLSACQIYEDVENMNNVEKALYHGARIGLAQMQDLLAPDFEVCASSFHQDDGASGEITMTGINKSFGIQKIMEYRGKGREDVIAFGDGPNDFDMLSFAGVGIAMGNGSPTLKKKADFVTLDLDEDGIAYAMDALGLI